MDMSPPNAKEQVFKKIIASQETYIQELENKKKSSDQRLEMSPDEETLRAEYEDRVRREVKASEERWQKEK